jgi:hypothetical protein
VAVATSQMSNRSSLCVNMTPSEMETSC